MAGKREELTIEPNATSAAYGCPFAVYRHGVYEQSSVLAGSPKRTFLDSFETVEAAQAKYPQAEVRGFSTKVHFEMPRTPPDWFDPTFCGEVWSEEE
jgi:hypothetical protein